ncbi:hypothetical protein HZH68_006559 [Vespula germanica]|uniref:Uncharacterized protein n=1 Tax=Vespula germanica TaxID=30212 RepID=A0A834KC04_VESGE|nr:hypothetical protein HZH68_006559 [Vespula germanica]
MASFLVESLRTARGRVNFEFFTELEAFSLLSSLFRCWEKRGRSILGRPFECFRDSEGREVLSVSSELVEILRRTSTPVTASPPAPAPAPAPTTTASAKGRPAWKLAFSGALKVSNAFYAACTPLSALTASYEYGAGFLSALNMRL